MTSVLRFVRRRKVLVVVLALVSALVADSLRSPSKQIAAGVYVAVVHTYQRIGRPAVNRWIHCRCDPTCSVYSVQAVRTYGFVEGLYLTVRRLFSCLHASLRAYSQGMEHEAA